MTKIEVIKFFGGVSKVSKALNLSQPTVSMWNEIPIERQCQIQLMTNNQLLADPVISPVNQEITKEGYASIKKAIETEAITSIEKLILIVLASYIDDDYCCSASYNTLAQQTKYSKRTVIRAVQKLEEKGFVKITKRKINTNENSSNIYKLMLKGGRK